MLKDNVPKIDLYTIKNIKNFKICLLKIICN